MVIKIRIRQNVIFLCSALLLLGVTWSCSIKKRLENTNHGLQTEVLYMQSKHPTIELPSDNWANGRGAVVAEQVSYNHADNQLSDAYKKDTTKKSINDVQTLNEVVVTAKSRFTPEHKGKVDVDFVIKVPKDLLSSKWRLTLSPKLMHNDSVISLENVIIKGNDFLQMQKNDYDNYDKFVKSIVSPKSYDSVFLDRKNTERDIKNFQSLYYKKYASDWKKQKRYLNDLSAWEARQNALSVKQREYKARTYPIYARKATEEKIKKLLSGKDTTGIYAYYMKEYNSHVSEIIDHFEERKQGYLKQKPQNGLAGVSLHGIQTLTFGKKDSVALAKNRYNFKDIALNELKTEQKDLMFNQYVKYPYEQNTRLDSIVDGSTDFTFLYKKTYTVVPGLKKLRIFMDAKFEATDQSSYFSPSADTLSYFIASLAQLTDTTLSYQTANLTRIGYNQMSTQIKYSPKAPLFNIKYKDNKEQVEKVAEYIHAIQKNKVYALDSIEINVSRSLAGKYEYNKTISDEQANAFKAYLIKTYGDSITSSTKVISQGLGEDWNGLVQEIQRSDKVINKQEILGILTSAKYPDPTEDDIRKKYKTDFAFIRDSIYPRLEKTTVMFHLRRTDMTQDKEVRRNYKGDEYAEGVRLLVEREYENALPKLANYADFNTALCLACMGYNAKAYELLKGFSETADNEYLLSILSYRLKKEDEAVTHLKRAIELDSSKKYRIKLDAEAIEIAEKYNIGL